MDKTEQNVLIAKFMGGEPWICAGIPNIGFADKLLAPAFNGVPIHEIDVDELLYHRSWDWLMPVVEKIEHGNYGFKMCRNVVEIYYDDTKEVILSVKEGSRIQSLYSALILFITMYNDNKLQHLNHPNQTT